MTPRTPCFIVGGAPRSGTTWLYRLLERHPDIHLARPLRPEPKFFLVDELYARGLGYYRERWFRDVPPGARSGEKSSNYLESPSAAGRIAQDLPWVKLVFILRNPVERAYSNYLWTRMNGLETETFERALALEAQRERDCPPELRYARPHAYFSRGQYAELLRPYLARLPREQMLVLQFEEILQSPQALTRRLHSFLDVAPRTADANGLEAANPSEPEGSRLDPVTRRELHMRYAESNRALSELLGVDFSGWEAPRAPTG
ncbi:MAG: sulfotransferase [SAR324 cluster bacterium]|nr:sulfotransferase [SAR324 cluster bacterium]